MIRKLTADDRELYISMAEEFYHSDAVLSPVPRSYIEKTVDDALPSDAYAELFVCEQKGEIAGYGLTAKTFSQEAGGFVLWIEEIYIREPFRSKGLGREFFAYIEDHKGENVTRLRLEVEEDNTRAVALYKKLGYKVLDYVQMIKEN